MIKRRRIFLHIGLPKTGSTSFQHTLSLNEDLLKKEDIIVYRDRETDFGKAKSVFLPEAVMRDGVFRNGRKFLAQKIVKARLKTYAEQLKERALIISSEPLSFIRTKDEIDLLGELLEIVTSEIKVIIVLREESDWWESYKNNVLKSGEVRAIHDKQSERYIGTDSWIRDWNGMLKLYEDRFGKLEVLQYNSRDMTAGLMAVIGCSEVKMRAVTKRYAARKRHLQAWNLWKNLVGSISRFRNL